MAGPVSLAAVTGALCAAERLTVRGRPKTVTRALRVYTHNEQLGVKSTHVYGYRAECSCGWRGYLWDEYGTAAKEARWHRGTHDERGA